MLHDSVVIVVAVDVAVVRKNQLMVSFTFLCECEASLGGRSAVTG